jgi:hypothetical protein
MRGQREGGDREGAPAPQRWQVAEDEEGGGGTSAQVVLGWCLSLSREDSRTRVGRKARKARKGWGGV